MARIEPQTWKRRPSIISEHVLSTDFQQTFQKYWCSSSDFKDTNLEIISTPFRVCRISNFLKKEFLEEVKGGLLDSKFRRIVNDLYQFEQTDDLYGASNKAIQTLYKVFKTRMTRWMSSNVKLELNGVISMSSSCYYNADYLLCHDDNMGDRKLAFVLYLMDEWTLEDGGALDLFDTDEHCLPKNVVRSIVPECNSLIFFEVTNNSYHQVREITSTDRCRWSINGWFHGPLNISEKPPRPMPMHFIKPIDKEIELDSWFSEKYLSNKTIRDIQMRIERTSYIYLKDFLKPDVYEKILINLKMQDIHWQTIGPADERHYEIADEQTLPPFLKDFYDLFKSIIFFKLLKGYTDLDLMLKTESAIKPKMTMELQRFSAGCYTLIIDRIALKEVSTDSQDSTEGSVTSHNELDKNDEEDACVSERKSFYDIPKYPKLQLDNIETSSSESEPVVFKKRKDDENKDDETYECAVSKDLNRKVSRSPQPSSSKSEDDPIKLGKTPHNYFRRSYDSSDIEDYMSHSDSLSSERSDNDSGLFKSLDLIMQFHVANAIDERETIDYVNPNVPNGELIHIPAKENHFCLVYKATNIQRLHPYINQYCKGYFYNLICTYYE